MMKKFMLFLLASLPLVIACTSDDQIETINTTQLPSTEVFVQGLQLFSEDETATRAAYQWPLHSNEGWETARFSIRVDGTIPDFYDKSSALYWGRFQGGNNKGKVTTLYPYGHYNDRDLDYTKKDKSTGENIGEFRYVYDRSGMSTQLAILEYPLVEDILTDELETNHNASQRAKINDLLTKDSEYLNSHVLWYVVKEVGMKYGWHVNGVFVDYVVAAPQAGFCPDEVEVDIHQQEHKDWNGIKTSVHIRSDVESVTVNLPIAKDNIIEQDDFDIRVFNYYYADYPPIKVTMTHNDNGITILISDIPAALIAEAKEQFGDGITVEVYSYTSKADGVWAELKKSSVSTKNYCTIKGQVTSAFNDERVPIYASSH